MQTTYSVLIRDSRTGSWIETATGMTELAAKRHAERRYRRRPDLAWKVVAA